MSDRQPFLFQAPFLAFAICGLCSLWAAAGTADASEFPREVCGAATPLLEPPAPELEHIDVDSSYGVAFSGGGSRSAAATIGQLRGLHLAGILPHIGYISAVSGGAWAALPYTYHPGGPEGLETFLALDQYRLPEELTKEVLRTWKKDSFAKALGDIGFFVTRFFGSFFRGKGNEIWSDIVGEELLEPFGLYDRKFTFGWRDPVPGLQTRLPDLESRHIPYLLVGGIVKCECSNPERMGDKLRLPLEISPLYTGVLPDAETCTGCPQNGYLQTYTIDNRTASARQPAPVNPCPEGQANYRIEKKKDLFTLSDALGITSSAPGVVLGKMMPFQTATLKTKQGWHNFKVRDGGGLDNLGLLPLLARKVPNITVFVNSKHAIEPDCSGKDCKWRKAVTSYFELAGTQDTGFLGPEQAASAPGELPRIFRGNGEDLVNHLADRKGNGKIPYYCGKFELYENNPLKLPEDYQPNICWVYLDRTQEWVNQLDGPPNELVDDLKHQRRPYKDFPHYGTFVAEGSRGQAADLDKKEILAMGQLTTWTVCEIAGDLLQGVEVGCSRAPQSQE